MKNLIFSLLFSAIILTSSAMLPLQTAVAETERERLLEEALINRYLETIGSTLQKPFGCEKITQITRLGDPRVSSFELVIEVVTYGQVYGQPPYDLVSLTFRDRPDLTSLTRFDKKRSLSAEEYRSRCSWFVR
ncbi:hypothetical protein NDK47_05885 [Brevibacillus ruminantium]|uniref:DUF3888 domain-containing protein n=1 Tax=Brevibacillus ruminantium TaxID=2950604 RepID=A0ABY4WIE9_9BACL|nr:hypothetical protein [Brevibacillus ruminantium]USG66828.1 hypothetical protein NDK47_05885 [Brevibacillus ruminantium]